MLDFHGLSASGGWEGSLNNVIVEVDSASMIKEESCTLWRLIQIVDKVSQIEREKRADVKRCYREANKVTNMLIAISHINKQCIIFSDFAGLPRYIRGLLNLYRLEITFFRVGQKKTAEIKFKPP